MASGKRPKAFHFFARLLTVINVRNAPRRVLIGPSHEREQWVGGASFLLNPIRVLFLLNLIRFLNLVLD